MNSKGSDLFSKEAHADALVRRRIKFVVEKGAVARGFKKATNAQLQHELFCKLKPSKIASLSSREEYDTWILGLIREDCWAPYSRNGLEHDRWAYFAKLLNIVIYEIVTHRELVSESDWQRLQFFLHLPLDSQIFSFLAELDASIPDPGILKDMTAKQYLEIQAVVRRLAAQCGVPPIWFEDAWSGTTGTSTRERQLKRNRLLRKKEKEAVEFAIQRLMKEKNYSREEAIRYLERFALDNQA